jgi:hypothetical protein
MHAMQPFLLFTGRCCERSGNPVADQVEQKVIPVPRDWHIRFERIFAIPLSCFPGPLIILIIRSKEKRRGTEIVISSGRELSRIISSFLYRVT